MIKRIFSYQHGIYVVIVKPKYFPSKRNTKPPVAYIIFFYLFVNTNVLLAICHFYISLWTLYAPAMKSYTQSVYLRFSPKAVLGVAKNKTAIYTTGKATVRRTTSSVNSALSQCEMYFFQYSIQY